MSHFCAWPSRVVDGKWSFHSRIPCRQRGRNLLFPLPLVCPHAPTRQICTSGVFKERKSAKVQSPYRRRKRGSLHKLTSGFGTSNCTHICSGNVHAGCLQFGCSFGVKAVVIFRSAHGLKDQVCVWLRSPKRVLLCPAIFPSLMAFMGVYNPTCQFFTL